MLWFATALAAAAPAGASFLIGGLDGISRYDSTTGVFSFQVDGAPGQVTSTGGVPGLLPLDQVFFEAMLSSTKCNAGSTPFNPATDNPNGACFLPVSGATPDLVFTDAAGTTTLLEFSLDHISVTQAVPALGGDPDGFLVMGDFVVTTQSLLILTGGTLAAAAGGVGSTAHLHVRMDTVVPGVTFANLNGYLGSDFEAGDGIGNSPVVWDLLIIPIPEPSTGVLLAGALAGLAIFRRRARSA